MTTNVNLNGVSYGIPAVGESNWGSAVSSYLIALSTGVLTKAGGSFTLTAEADFGATFGLKAAYFKSRGTAAAAGVFRLANTELVSWRNAANSADLGIRVSSSNWLQFAGVDLADISSAQTFTNKTVDVSANTFSNIVNANIGSGAAIAYSKLNLSDSILNADINSAAAIAYSKLDLAGALKTSDLESGFTLAIGNGGTGQTTAAAAFKVLAQYSAKGDLVGYDGSATGVLGVGTDGQVLSADSGSTYGFKWASVLANPMTTTGDIIYSSDGSGTPARLAAGTSGQWLVSAGAAAPTWSSSVSGAKTFNDGVKVDDGTEQSVLSFFAQDSVSSTFTANGTSGGTSTSVAMKVQRVGDWVTLFVPAFSASSGTSSTYYESNSSLPTWARPAAAIKYAFAGRPLNNASSSGGAAMILMLTTGPVRIYRDGSATAFTNSSTCGLGDSANITYYVGTGS